MGCLLLAVGCLDAATSDNDGDFNPAGSGQGAAPITSSNGGSSAPAAGGTTSGASGSSAASGGGSGGSSGGNEGNLGEIPLGSGGTAIAGGASGSAGALSGGGMSGSASMPDESPAPRPELVAGTATSAGCFSFSEPEGDACGTYYCGVDEPTLDQALDPAGLCGEDQGNLGGVAFVCQARPVSVVGTCAREERAANLFANTDERRVRIRDCVYQDAEIATNMREACLDCFIDVALCAGDNCLIQCLAGDSAACDACRQDNDCERPLFACSGLPDPF